VTDRNFVQDMYKASDEAWSYAYVQGCLMTMLSAHSRGIASNRDLWRLYRDVEEAHVNYTHLLAADPSAKNMRDQMLAWSLRRAGGGDSTPVGQADPR